MPPKCRSDPALVLLGGGLDAVDHRGCKHARKKKLEHGRTRVGCESSLRGPLVSNSFSHFFFFCCRSASLSLRPLLVLFSLHFFLLPREVAFLHLFLSVFFLMEHLCHSEAICAGLWDLYDFVTARAGDSDGNGGSIAET